MFGAAKSPSFLYTKDNAFCELRSYIDAQYKYINLPTGLNWI